MIINRDVLKSKMVLYKYDGRFMCDYLGISSNSYCNKLNGKRGFNEEEISKLVALFDYSIFFDFPCYEKRNERR